MWRRRDDRGAVLPMVALIMVVLVGISAIAVDLGMQRVARRDMQALADPVALDLARLVDGRTASAINAGSGGALPLTAAKNASVARNSGSTLGHPPVVTAVLISLDASGDPVLNPDGSIKQVSGSGIPDAVYVTAVTEVDFAFATGSGGAGRSAIGTSSSNACFKLGSFAAAVNSGNSLLLGKYLNDALDLHAVGYEGLADAAVTLGALAAELGVGSVDGLANLKSVSLRNLYLAAARALQKEGGQAADINLLNTLAGSVETSLHVDVAQLVDLSTGGTAALTAKFNVLDLVAGGAFVANGSNFLDLPVLWNVPQVSQGPTSLQIIEKPQVGCGRAGAKASTAQLRLRATPKLNIPTIAGLSADSVPMQLDVDIASATASLTDIVCGQGSLASPESVAVSVNRSLSTASLSVPIHLTGDVKASDIITNPLLWGLSVLLGGTKATVDLTVNLGLSVNLGQVNATGTYAVPPHDYSDPEHIGGSSGLLLPQTTLDVSDFSGTIKLGLVTRDLAGISLTNDVTFAAIMSDLVSKNVLAGVNGFIANVNAQLTPLTQLLGIQTAGADLFGIPSPACNEPTLAG